MSDEAPDFKLTNGYTLSLNRHGRLGVYDPDCTAEGGSIDLTENALRALSKHAERVADELLANSFESGEEVMVLDDLNAVTGRIARVARVDGRNVVVTVPGHGCHTVDPRLLRRLAAA